MSKTKNKSKLNSNIQSALLPDSPIQNKIAIIISICIGLLLFFPPFFRGLFFNEQMFIMHILTAIVFILYWGMKFYRKDYEFISTSMDLVLLLYVGAYLLSIFGAVHFGEAVYGFLRILNYFIIYWLVSQTVDSWRKYRYMLQVLLAAGFGVALVGILAATGLYNYPSAFDGRVIASTMQYTNSTAAYLAAVTILAFSLWVDERNTFLKIIYSLASFIMVMVILCTLSKGAWVILVLGAVLLVIGRRGIFNKVSLIYEMIIVSSAAFLTYNYFLPSVTSNPNPGGLKFIVGGMLLVCLCRLLWMLFERLYVKNRAVSVLGFLIFIAGAFALLLKNKLASIFVSNDFLVELAGLKDFGGSSFVSRLDIYKWGLEIGRDYPINGTGAGGWNALYHQYQDYLLWTTEVHNHFIQVWVDAGSIGLVVFCSIWILLVYLVFKIYQNKSSIKAEKVDQENQVDHSFLIWGTFVAAIALGLHAAIDFDLSIGAICVLLWALFALVNAAFKLVLPDQKRNLIGKPVISVILAGVLAISLLWTGCSYSLANIYSKEAALNMSQLQLAKDNQSRSRYLTEGIRLYEKASALDGSNADYLSGLAGAKTIAYNSLKSTNVNDPNVAVIRKQIMEHIKKAEKLKPYDVKIRNSLLYTCSNIGDVDGVLRQGEGLIKANPNDIKAYSAYATVLWAGIDYWDKMGQKEKAQILVKKVIEIPELVSEQNKRINPDRIQYWAGAPLQLPEDTLALVERGRARHLTY